MAALIMPIIVSALTFAQAPVAKAVGTIKTINGGTLTVATDDGATTTVVAQDATRILQVEPGQKDLKDAKALQLQDLQAGDRILVRGKTADDAKSLLASSIIVMKRSDVEAKQQQQREDWQRHGVGGLVTAVDPTSGTVTIAVASLAGKKEISIHTTKSTILRRYAPGSVKFDDAKPGSFDQIRPGDQLRARGTRSADGLELAADEIVWGSFRNIEGTVSSIDESADTMTVQDAMTKKPVVVRLTTESQLRKLPPPVAQRIAARLKGTPPGQPGAGGPPSAAGSAATGGNGSAGGGGNWQGGGGGAGAGARPAGSGDLQQMLGRLPASTIKDFQKGDAVMIVSTAGAAGSEVTAITVLGGVEPILTASPSGQSMILSPWSLGSQGADAASQ